MSFRQFGGLQFASKHNAVSSYYNTSNNLLVTQNVGQPNSYINFQSDISGNINITSGSAALTGSIHHYAGNTVPSGYLLCDGSTLNIANFPNLFAAIGTIYGGDGTTTFGLPTPTAINTMPASISMMVLIKT
jgi:hypothetical protein